MGEAGQDRRQAKNGNSKTSRETLKESGREVKVVCKFSRDSEE